MEKNMTNNVDLQDYERESMQWSAVEIILALTVIVGILAGLFVTLS